MIDKNKIKFQNPNFRKKLEDARGYRRAPKKIPQGKWGIFSAAVGLGSLRSKIYLALAIVFVLYFAYFPNFLFVKNLQISGLSEEGKIQAEKNTRDFLAKRWPVPQGNLLLLSKQKLADYLLKKNFGISQIVSIEKDFPSTLHIILSERFDKFLLQTPKSAYVAANDGKTVRQLNATEVLATDSPFSSLIPISLETETVFYENQSAFEASYIRNLNLLLDLLRGTLNSETQRVYIESPESPEIKIKNQYGWTWFFDINSDLNKTVAQAALLLKDIGQARIHSIKYIDMRIKDRGFVCYIDAACANVQSAQLKEATTTVESNIDR